ncbi:MAG: hypothetical protein JXR46_00715 [Calditrichaceae bacterium]|nr:hypothetical protein [Calditrichaceae bacterium]MBN2707536.1 hypothetical protein [Calditrichaceae bacterium]RQV95625.1 MAG: hypothetical protein EH224_07120 [Calditrichota bacterium]
MNKLLSFVVLLLFTLSISSCGWKAGEEDIKLLEEAKAAALAAEKSLADKKAERQGVEKQVEAKQAELAKIQADKEKVLQRVAEMKAAE